ncbi:hypothetical protein TVAGG3_0191870 [Trichomonas vaginalis G3]|uniref:hypothetical protein n=1 Tax=Trichomonas vaginalis (strain ATCC PRA-98 / G3) TaxID=412133 RepID=UPI0021E5B5FB|nr:hypothetical protein TVAGG3_0191870 [Trichomonas vaginalis G3]KAI5550033.1 hypothetical protein TVAGG3_0191870 [Trichomonas vaginalis G3]
MFYTDHEIYNSSISDSENTSSSFSVCVRSTFMPEGFAETFDSDPIEFDSSDIITFDEVEPKPSSMPTNFSQFMLPGFDLN